MQAVTDNPFLRGLTSDQLDLLVPLFNSMKTPGGAAIFKQGDLATHLYIIHRGTVTIQYKPYDGPIITLSHLEAGEIFGWSSIAGGPTYTSDAICMTEVETLRVRGADLLKLCAAKPAAGSAILERLAAAVSPRWTYARQQIQGILESQAQLQDAQTHDQART